MTRLRLTDARLLEELRQADESARRRAALAAVTLALERTGLAAELSEAVDQLVAGRFTDSPARELAMRTSEFFDDAAWKAQEASADDRREAHYVAAFARARAAKAIWYAFDPDSFRAAAEAIYEASHAVGSQSVAPVVIAAMDAAG